MTAQAGAPPQGPEGARTLLHLVSPPDLPTELALTPEERARLRPLLAAFLSAMAGTDPAAMGREVAALAARLGPNAAPAAQVAVTGTPVPLADIEDFDRFFGIRRVTDATLADSLLRTLFETAAPVLSLMARSAALSEQDVARQVRGFAAHARLLGRICELEGLE